jgi:hypothetical protein
MIGNMLEIGSRNFSMLVLDNAEGRMGMLLVMRSPVHSMVDFPRL